MKITAIAVCLLLATLAGAASREDCAHGCRDAYKTRQVEERLRYEAAIPGCNEDRECLDAQRKLSSAIHQQHVVMFRECHKGCDR